MWNGYLHVDLIARISPNHVQDCKTTSRMLFEPAIKSKDIPFCYDNDLTVCDAALDGPGTEDLITVHGD